MIKTLCTTLLFLALSTGCASTIEPTTFPPPVQPTLLPILSLPTQPGQDSSSQTQPLPAQQTSQCKSKVSGRVSNAQGQPAPNATIDVKSGKFTGKTVSDNSGLYGFAGLCAGNYTFVVTLPGQKAVALKVSTALDGANSQKVNLDLK